MIVILTNKYDLSADYVVRALKQKNQTLVRLNTEDILDGQSVIMMPRTENKTRILNKFVEDAKSVWLRRPGRPFDMQHLNANNIQRPTQQYVENQWHAFLEGFENISNAFWMNSSHANRKAENKIMQMQTAAKQGFNVPRTCITSSKSEALEFFGSCDNGIVAKSLDAPLLEYPEGDYFIFTNEIISLHDVPEAEFRLAPTIFQERIYPKSDYRVTVIGEDVFAVKIVAPPTQADIDWRTHKDAVEFVPTDIPSEIRDNCINLVRTLGLTFGAIDLVETGGNFHFLEINPNGEWGWLQKQCNLAIGDSIADYLINIPR